MFKVLLVVIGYSCSALHMMERHFNWLAPGRSYYEFKKVIFNLALLIGIFKSSYDNVLRWLPQDLTDDKSTLVQVMVWCRQCWPRSPTPYGVTRINELKRIYKKNANCQGIIAIPFIGYDTYMACFDTVIFSRDFSNQYKFVNGYLVTHRIIFICIHWKVSLWAVIFNQY